MTTALTWTLTWLLPVLSAASELPQPVNLTLSSHHLHHALKWQPGPATPHGVYYHVSIKTDNGIFWEPALGCEHIQRPLACDLTDVFSDPWQHYFVQIQAKLGKQASRGTIYPRHTGFTPIRDTHLDVPLLTVTACGRDLCVDLQPPMEHLRPIYDRLGYQLKVESDRANEAKSFWDIKTLRRQILENLAPGREYCVSVRIWDTLLSKESNYSQAVCGVTSGSYADPWISAVLCVLVVFGVVAVALLVPTGFICLRRGLPLVLTSIRHMEAVQVAEPCSASLSSLLNVRPAPPPAGGKRSEQSSDESEGEGGAEAAPGSRGAYKLWAGANPSSSSSSSSLSAAAPPEAEPRPGPAPDPTPRPPSPPPRAPAETHPSPDSVTAEAEEGGEGVVVVGEGGGQDVNLLTLTFGRREEEEEQLLDVAPAEPGSRPAPEDHAPPPPPSPRCDAEGVTAETASCSAEEEEEEEEDEGSGYMGRPCAAVLQNLLLQRERD